MMRFLRKGDCYALNKPIKKYYYQPLYSFKCLLLSLSTYYYQFSCNVQKSRASGTTGYDDEGESGDAKRSNAVLLLTIFCVLFSSFTFTQVVAQTHTELVLRGEVRSAADGQAIEGASIIVDKKHARTDKQGRFTISVNKPTGTLTVKHIGYNEQKIAYANTSTTLQIRLVSTERQIEEVEVVSTGYQRMSKEHVVGSVDVLDEKILNRSVSSNILNRIDGLVTAVHLPKFNSTEAGPQPQFTIRGKSTLFANAEPLIVVDGFPYEGQIDELNPADIASVSILKDAATASIWGARSGNGVLVITTKSGNHDKASIAAEIIESMSSKPDLWYNKRISSSEYIDVEKFLFDKGAFNSRLKTGYQAVSPVVEILNKINLGELSHEEGNKLIDSYRDIDVRHQQLKYLYRNPFEQQYNLSITSPLKDGSFYLSGGINRLNKTAKLNADERKTLLMKYNRSFFKDKWIFSFQSNIGSTNTQKTQDRSLIYPYENILSSTGERLHLTTDLRRSYIDTAGNGNLLDWSFNPLTDLGKGMSGNSTLSLRLNGAVDAKLLPFLTASIKYQYSRSNGDDWTHYAQDSYHVRNMINTFTKYDKATDKYLKQIPEGEIRVLSNTNNNTYLWRGQLSLDKDFGARHRLTALAAFEIADTKGNYDKKQLWGYDPTTGIAATLDHINAMLKLTGGSQVIADGNNQSWYVDRYRSYLLNAAYNYKRVYDLYASVRRDESNLFGVETNQKGVPLWSVGAAYNMKKDLLKTQEWLSELRLRSSYGVQGNVDKSISAWLTARYESYKNRYQSRFATIVNPPNPSLRWEKTNATNIGIDVGFFNQRIAINFDSYWKKGKDLIGNGPIAPQTGLIQFKGNVADTEISGFDLSIKSRNLTGKLHWQSVFNFSKAKHIVTKYLVKQSSNLDYMQLNYINPYEGYPQTALFSFPYAGLDSEGNPIGYLDAEESKDYNAILRNEELSNVQYHGPRIPPYFGSFRNEFNYGGFYASINMSYSFGAFFRRESLNNNSLYSSTPAIMTVYDYDKRWKKPGDELSTGVPALIYPSVSNRSTFYNNSSVLVEKADVIRIRDIQIGCRLLENSKWIKAIDMTFVVDNVAVLWRANNYGLDPDIFQFSYPVPRQFSLRLRTTL